MIRSWHWQYGNYHTLLTPLVPGFPECPTPNLKVAISPPFSFTFKWYSQITKNPFLINPGLQDGPYFMNK